MYLLHCIIRSGQAQFTFFKEVERENYFWSKTTKPNNTLKNRNQPEKSQIQNHGLWDIDNSSSELLYSIIYLYGYKDWKQILVIHDMLYNRGKKILLLSQSFYSQTIKNALNIKEKKNSREHFSSS